MSTRNPFAAQLTQARHDLNLSQRNVAELADVSQATVVNVEHDRRNVSLSVVQRIAAVYGLELHLAPREDT